MGGSLVDAAGKLTLGSADSVYLGLTEAASGAELHVIGSLAGDVAVSGKLVVDGTIYGTVTAKGGGLLLGAGAVGAVDVQPGGNVVRMIKNS